MRRASERRRQLRVDIALRRIELGLGEEHTVAEVGASEVSTPEVSPGEVSHSQIGAPEVSSDEVCPSQVGAPEVRAPEVRASEVLPDEVGSTVVDVLVSGLGSHEFARAYE